MSPRKPKSYATDGNVSPKRRVRFGQTKKVPRDTSNPANPSRPFESHAETATLSSTPSVFCTAYTRPVVIYRLFITCWTRAPFNWRSERERERKKKLSYYLDTSEREDATCPWRVATAFWKTNWKLVESAVPFTWRCLLCPIILFILDRFISFFFSLFQRVRKHNSSTE